MNIFYNEKGRVKTQTAIPCECLLGGCALCAQVEKFERRYGRDALNNTSGECVVAKANEADCLANAEVQTREERGNFNLRVHDIHSRRKKKHPSRHCEMGVLFAQ